ncbi:MAG: endo-1,4-beta-xylanase [Lachnospiraceae bacterium]|nr:endo-1,4-beta-xylanase [Lachnospiraceae bacterium]
MKKIKMHPGSYHKTIGRYICLLACLCLVLTSTTACSSSAKSLPAQSEVTDKAIKDVFAEHGVKVGTCISSQVINNSRMAGLVMGQYNSCTMENAMKPDYILNQEQSIAQGTLVVEFGYEAKLILEWAKNHNFAMRGHTLIWYSQTPDWIFHQDFDVTKGFVDREEMLSRMESLIKGTFDELERLGYLNLFYAYDVVNEAWNENGTMRDSYWHEIIGDDYLWHAFYFADKYAPESIDLYYNDYNEQYKADTIAAFVTTLKDEKGRSLIDGIGLQGHLFTSDDLTAYFEAIDILAKTGLKLELTEIDVGLGAYQKPFSPTDDKLRLQGRYYYELIGGLFDRIDAGTLKMDAITFWGFSDGISWRKEYAPQLYDSSLNPKYALYGAMQIKDYAGY